MPKMMREKMADEGLQSYIVTYYYPHDEADSGAEELSMQFWAEDEGHAGEQFDDAEPDGNVTLVETQDEHERRTGLVLGYGRSENA